MDSRRQQYGVLIRRPATVRPGNAVRRASRLPVTGESAESLDLLGRDDKLARLEAALLLADEPLPSRKLATVAGLADGHEARRLIEKLKKWYDEDGSAFQIQELAGGYQVLTRAVFHSWLLRLRRTGHDVRLTPAALETLAVIAYKQPLTRADIEAIRGVAVAEMIRLLMEKGLVRVGGRHESLGRPQLYVTTKRFLQVFGLNTLDQLPEVDSLKKPG